MIKRDRRTDRLRKMGRRPKKTERDIIEGANSRTYEVVLAERTLKSEREREVRNKTTNIITLWTTEDCLKSC